MKETHKRDTVMRQCNWAMSKLSEALGCFIMGDEAEAQADVNDRHNTRFWRGEHLLDHAQDLLKEAADALKLEQYEIRSEVADVAVNFHTFLRKACSSTSSAFLYDAINIYSSQWNILLSNISEFEDFEKRLNAEFALELLKTFDSEHVYELKVAFEFFKLQEPELAEKLWSDLFKN